MRSSIHPSNAHHVGHSSAPLGHNRFLFFLVLSMSLLVLKNRYDLTNTCFSAFSTSVDVENAVLNALVEHRVKELVATNIRNNQTEPKDLPSTPKQEDYQKISSAVSQTLADSSSTSLPNIPSSSMKVIYKGCSGLGHRLARMSNAYHFTKAMNLEFMEVDWKVCKGSTDEESVRIFEYLFGSRFLKIPTTVPISKLYPWFRSVQVSPEANASSTAKREIAFPCEVTGYHLKGRYNRTELPDTNYYGKLDSDYEMFSTMIEMFEHQHNNVVGSFQKANRFEDHTVIGLHLRGGNGESGGFLRQDREIPNPEKWLANMATLLSNFTKADPRFQKKPPLIFVATDTPSFIEKMTKLLEPHSIPVVSFSQTRVPEGSGISAFYEHSSAKDCLDTWKSQLIDMIMLAQSDLVAAGMYSSFTQILPLSLQFRKIQEQKQEKNPQNPLPGIFCEIGPDGSMMDCYNDFFEWRIIKRSSLPTWGNTTAEPQRRNRLVMFPKEDVSKDKIREVLEGTTLTLG